MSDTLDYKNDLNRYQVDTPSTLNILDITEDCTRLVFDRLTLNQLIHLRAVCHTWNDIITDICEHKSTLQLFFSKYSPELYYSQTVRLNVQDDPTFRLRKQNYLLISPGLLTSSNLKNGELKRTGYSSFSDQKNGPNLGIRFIARLFPNITNFACDFQNDRMLEQNYILKKWSTSLVTLTIFSNHYGQVCPNAHKHFVKCLEELSSLRRLHLLCESDRLDIPKVRTFAQLEEFSFNNSRVKLGPYFALLDPNCCKILRVGAYSEGMSSLNPITHSNPDLVLNLTHLSISFTYALTNHISLHWNKFRNLTHVEIVNEYACPMAFILQQILPLQKLKILQFDRMERYSYTNPNYRKTFPIFHNTITELRLVDKADKSYFPEFEGYQLLAKIFPIVVNVKIYSNNLNKATFDAQFRPRFSEAFGERVEVTFFPNNKFCVDDFC